MAEKIVMSRTHSSQKHLSVCLITIGIIMCTFESAKTLENQSNFIDWSIGIVMLSTSLVLSALMGVNQERIFAKWGKHYEEALFFTVIIPGVPTSLEQVQKCFFRNFLSEIRFRCRKGSF